MKKMGLMILVISAVLSTPPSNAAEAEMGYRLYFPAIHLDQKDGERIEEIGITVACGHIESVTFIPYDWNIEITRAISAVEEFRASAGHGASRLSGMDKLNGAIRITVGDKSCFDVSATIQTSGTEKGRQIDLPRTKLQLRP
jgi:hypothetical protein